MGLKPIAIPSLRLGVGSIYANLFTYLTLLLGLVASFCIAMGFKPIAMQQLLPLFLKAISLPSKYFAGLETNVYHSDGF